MRSKILKMLRESDGYISGQQLCEELGVSRTAVWKVVNQLKEAGYEVEAVRNRGYRIVSSPDAITAEELSSVIDSQWAAKKIYYFEETDSTNIRAKRLGDHGEPRGTLVVANQQNAGRGRRGRGWVSPEGCSIYMSLLLRPIFHPTKAPMLTLVMALAVAKGVNECTGLDVEIKWPNDIVINGKKLVGILTEMSTEVDYINHVVIGVGINVNMERMPEELQEKATSLRIESGHTQKRSELIAEIMRQFERYYALFLETQDLRKIQDEYNELLVNRDEEVRVLGTKDEYNAYALGINQEGELLVKRQDGITEAIFAGEVSVRGVYGYV